MSEWYYAADNEQKGPVTETELKRLLASNQVAADALVWKDGMDNWTAANQLPALRADAPAASKPAGAAPKTASAEPDADPADSTQPVDFTKLMGPGKALKVEPEDAETNKVFGILAYLGPLCFVSIIVAKDSPYTKYHAYEGLVLFLAEFATVIITGALVFIPFLGFIIYFLHVILSLVFLAAAIYGIINAAAGKCVPLPLLGGIADQLRGK